jgi:hypothetical protein
MALGLLFTSNAFATPLGFVKTTIPLNAPPVGLAFDAGGTLFALEGAPFGDNEATLRVFPSNGSIGPSFTIAGDDASNFFVGGMTYDQVGSRVLVTDNTADGRLYAIDSLGMKHTIAMNVAGVADVAVRSTGQIFVSTAPFGAPGQVLQVDRTTGAATPVMGGLGYGAGVAFDVAGNLIVQDANTTTFAGRLQRLPMTGTSTELTIGLPEPLLDGMQSSAGLEIAGGVMYSTGSGGLYRVGGMPLAETPFDSNGSMSQFATAMAFDPGSEPFDGFLGPAGGRLAYMADFGFGSQNSFVTVLSPARPGDYNGDGSVTAADYEVWRGAYGTTDAAADGTRDGAVDAADFVLWRKNLTPAQGAVPGASVPEPAAAVLLLSLLLLAIGLRRRPCPIQSVAA